MVDIFVILGIISIIVIALLLIWFIAISRTGGIELPEKRAGRIGESIATAVIQEILREDDVLLTNVEICVQDRQTELDNVIVNGNGAFVIEVKNWSGALSGTEDDYEWIESKMTPGGYFYQKKLKNPIRQIKRQIYILSQFLKQNEIHVWVNGYVFFVQYNSPIESQYILKTQQDIDIAIHGNIGNALTDAEIKKIKDLLYHG